MTRCILFFVLVLVWQTAACAQSKGIDRPDNYSNIIGKYAIKVSADPTDVYVEEAITLRIYLTGSGPKEAEPKRANLRLFPDEWKNDFYVQGLPDQDEVMRDKKTWLFVYRLKAKHVNLDAIDDIKLVYYDPDLPGEKKHVTKYADRISLKVRPKPDSSKDVEFDLKTVPDSFRESAPSGKVLTHPPQSVVISNVQLAVFLALPPLVCLCGALVWRRWFPDESRRAFRHRSASAQRALAQLHDVGAPAWDVVRRYLHERFRYPAADAVPLDVSAFLKQHGFALAVCRQSREFFEQCDAVRFTAALTPPSQLAAAAAHLIQALEADPCARLSIGILLLAWQPALAQGSVRSDEEVLAQAEGAFRLGVENQPRLLHARKHFADAADAYRLLHARGVRSAALYRSLGNAAVLADRWPEAVWAYHQGLRLDPNDGATRAHLAFARAKVLYPPAGQGRPDADTWPDWLHRPTINEYFCIGGLTYLLAWLVGTCALVTRRLWFTLLAIILAVTTAGAVIGLMRELSQAEIDRQTPLVVLAGNTDFFRGNAASYPKHFTTPLLPRGLEARQLHRRGAWLQIRLTTGETGWVRASSVMIVEP